MSFNGIRNPRSTQPSSSFTLQTMDRDLYTIDKSSLFTVTMTTPGDLGDISINMINSTNGAMTNHSVSFQTSIPIKSGDKMIMTFSNAIRFNATYFPVVCLPVSLISTMSCSVSGQILTVTLTTLTTSPNTGTFQFTIANITNPPSTRVSTVLDSVSYVDSSAYKIMNMVSTKVVSLQTTLAANMLGYKITQGRLDYDSTTTHTLTLFPYNRIGADGSLIITWPTQVTITSGVSCTVTTNNQYSANCIIDTTKRTISITKVFVGTSTTTGYTSSIIVALSPVRNPKDNRVVNGYVVNTYDDTSFVYKIDVLEDNKLVPLTPCTFPCKTCGSTKTQCSACWSDLGYSYL